MNPKPGDLVLAHGSGAFARLIRFGQWLRPSWRKYRTWNHAAIVIAVRQDGVIRCAQMGRRGEVVNIENVAPNGYAFVLPGPSNIDRTKAVGYALSQVGQTYSVLTILSIALNILTPSWLRIDFRRSTSLICSALVARAWEHGGWICPTDPFQITPAELAQWAATSTD